MMSPNQRGLTIVIMTLKVYHLVKISTEQTLIYNYLVIDALRVEPIALVIYYLDISF